MRRLVQQVCHPSFLHIGKAPDGFVSRHSAVSPFFEEISARQKSAIVLPDSRRENLRRVLTFLDGDERKRPEDVVELLR